MGMPAIVEKMYDFNVWLLRKVGKFPRDKRQLLGERLLARSLDIHDHLMAAALMEKGVKKTQYLAESSLALEQLRHLLRLACDSHCLSREAWFFSVKQTDEIGKMLGGWLKSI